MTYDDFMQHLETYFGPWYRRDGRGMILRDKDGNYIIAETVKRYVRKYLQTDIREDRLSTLWRYVLYARPLEYGPPDVAAIEKAIYHGMQNNRGSEVRKIKTAKYEPEEIDPEEIEEGRKMYQEAGGIAGIIGNPKLAREIEMKRKQEEENGFE